jgi:multiple sugar transport system substrate-binding protein
MPGHHDDEMAPRRDPSAQVSLSRRRLLAGAGSAAAAAGLGPAVRSGRAGAKGQTLTIAQWTHFVPAFAEWFDRKLVKEWGEKNDVQVLVDRIPPSDLRARAAAEVAAQRGHDVFGFPASPVAFEPHAVPLNDVVAECERRHGKLIPLAHRVTYSPRAQRYFALADSWAPNLLHYRTDWWGEVGVRPDSWTDIREGARRVKERHGVPAGFGLAKEHDSEMTLRGLLWSFGAAEQDEGGRVTINSRGTVEALKLMAAIFKESMTPEVFMWDPASNNRFFVWGRGSIIQNAVSAIRTAEELNPEVAARAALAPPASGPAARLGAATIVHSYVVWRFGKNVELAKRFLVDLVAEAEAALQASKLYNLPVFAATAREAKGRLAAARTMPRAYAVLAEAERWSVWPGYPGYTSVAIEDVLHASVIPAMFARVARGAESAEEAARRADAEMRRIFARAAR